MIKSIQVPIYNKAYDRAYIKTMLERCAENGGSYDSRKYHYVLLGGVLAIDCFKRVPLKPLNARRWNAAESRAVTLATYKWTEIEMRSFGISQADIDAATEAANK